MKVFGPVYSVTNSENSFSMHPRCSGIITEGIWGTHLHSLITNNHQPNLSPTMNLEASQCMQSASTAQFSFKLYLFDIFLKTNGRQNISWFVLQV